MYQSISRRTILAGIIATFLTLPRAIRANADTFSIAVSTPILRDIVANVVGNVATVFSIMPANADPHTWEPIPEDMVRLAEAHAFIYFGSDLEPFVETGGWRNMVQEHGIPELAVTDYVELLDIEEDIDHGDHHHDMGETDPHIWLDPLTIVQAVPFIADFVAKIDTANADIYKANGDDYVAELEALHLELKETLAVISPDRRKLLVFHDAWNYFAARYEFEIIGVVLENPDGEVSARELMHLLNVVEEHDIRVIFAEPQFNATVLNLLADEGGIEIATLLTDTFAEGVETYIELMLFNRDQLVAALAD